MRSGESRGFSQVLQLDDNIQKVGLVSCLDPRWRVRGDLDLFDLLRDFSAATNAAMLGAQLNSVQPSQSERVIRPGYPYSCFVEQVGPYRQPYYGPFEDDVMHALDYARGDSPVTAGVVPLLRYQKVSGGTTGMRAHYDASRGLELPRRYPENATLRMGPRTSGPKETARGMRHYLNTKGFTPVKVLDQELFSRAHARLAEWLEEAREQYSRMSRESMRSRGAGNRR